MKNQHNKAGPVAEISRREFMVGAGAAAVSFAILRPQPIDGAAAISKITWGLIGCGGRGSWIANLFQKHGGYQLVAAADYFQDRVDAVGKKFEVPESRRYTGLSA